MKQSAEFELAIAPREKDHAAMLGSPCEVCIFEVNQPPICEYPECEKKPTTSMGHFVVSSFAEPFVYVLKHVLTGELLYLKDAEKLATTNSPSP